MHCHRWRSKFVYSPQESQEGSGERLKLLFLVNPNGNVKNRCEAVDVAFLVRFWKKGLITTTLEIEVE